MSSGIGFACTCLGSQLPVAGDFRPYFTIHDPDHKRLMNKNAPVAGILIGTTNPFLYEECKHWPHIISLTPSSPSYVIPYPAFVLCSSSWIDCCLEHV